MLSSKTFDPYHKWLGIRPEEQPANYYRLLGIALFEDDADAIAGAADQRMAHVRSFQTGNYAALSQRLLNEIAAARVCLLTPQKKAAYDKALQARFIPPSPPVELPVDDIPNIGYSSTYKQHKKSTPSWMPWAFVGVGGLVVVIIFAVIAKSGREEQAVAKAPTTPMPQPTSPKIGPKKVTPKLDAKVDPKREPVNQDLALPEPKSESQPALGTDSGDEIKPASESTDLLCRIDVAANTVSGKWMMEEDGITTASGKILMPVYVDGEYDLAVTFTRHSGNDTVAVMLPVGLHRCGVILSGWNGQTSGIQLIDGKEAHSNPTARHPSILNNGQRHTLLIRVRKQDQLANIEVFLDKTAIASWQGNESSLDFGGEWQLPQIRRFALSTIQSTTFHSVQLKMISGKASWIDGGLLAKGKLEPKPAKPKLVVLEKDDSLPEVEVSKTKEPAKPQPEQPFKEKLPIPDDAAQQKSLATIRDVYKGENRAALAAKLLQKASETPDTTDRFVLLQEAKDLASETWQGQVAFEAIDVMASEYDISSPEMKAVVIEQAAKKPRITAEQKTAIANAALQVVDEAIGEDKFEVAKKAGRIASQLVRQTNNKDLLQEIVAKGKQVGAAAKAYADAQEAIATLKDKPDDPDANATVGKYLCFTKGNWDKGLPMLAKGSDKELKVLAAKDAAGATSAGKQVKLGDAWWGVSTERASYWYEQALPGLTGLEKDRVAKRVVVKISNENVFLADMNPQEAKVIEGNIHRPATFRGQISPHTLWAHPLAPKNSSHIVYELNKSFQTLRGAAGIGHEGIPESPLTFRIVGDGKLLWKSRPLQVSDESQNYDIDISRVKRLELFVDCPGGTGHCWGIWIDPVVIKTASEELGVERIERKHALGNDSPKLKSPKKINGVAVNSFKAGEKVHELSIGPTFDVRKSWVLSTELMIVDSLSRQTPFLWGDDRIGHDVVVLFFEGSHIHVIVEDCIKQNLQDIQYDFERFSLNKWIKIAIYYDTERIQLFVDNQMVKEEQCRVIPTLDHPMPIRIGGFGEAGNSGMRFNGQIRSMQLTNIL